MTDQCSANDWATNALTAGLCVATAASYLPQHWRIIRTKNSDGFSPWFLLLGCTAATGTMLNVVTLQWEVIKCCSRVNAGICLGLVGGIIQMAIIWAFFSFIFVLYMIYFPPHLKYLSVDVDPDTAEPATYGSTQTPSAGHRLVHVNTAVRTDAWRASTLLAWVVVLHFVFCLFVTVLLIVKGTPPSRLLWAAFLGLTSTCATLVQYIPQLVHTYRSKLVGALSIPTMFIQTPGAVVVIISIVVRPGTNWTSWATFAAAGLMQGALLVLCIVYKFRQRRLAIDDFGQPLYPSSDEIERAVGEVPAPALPDTGVPLTAGPDTPGVAITDALEAAVERDVRTPQTPALRLSIPPTHQSQEESAPLLGGQQKKGWWGRLTGQ